MAASASPVIVPVGSTSRPVPQVRPSSREIHHVGGTPAFAWAAFTMAVCPDPNAIPGSANEAGRPAGTGRVMARHLNEGAPEETPVPAGPAAATRPVPHP